MEPGVVQNVAIAGGFMAILAVALAWLLAVASRRLYVYEDPRIDEIETLLPKSNCGACGTAGCRNFAEQVVAGTLEPARCTVNAQAANRSIAALLGVALGTAEKRVARLACAGGRHVARTRARYEGLGTCRAAATVGGGGKACPWGCLGLGDCEVVCDFEALSLNQYGLPVVDEGRCTACGKCVTTCPKQLFSLQPVSHRLWVACANHAGPALAEAQCDVACTACGKCVADAAPGLLRLEDQLVRVDYSHHHLAARAAIERCPTGAIVWLEAGNSQRGRSAKKILRTTALPVMGD